MRRPQDLRLASAKNNKTKRMTVQLKQLPASYSFPFALNEEETRLEELYRMELLDTLSDERFELYTRLLAETLAVPLAFVTLVDREKIWLQCSRSELAKVHNDFSLCASTIRQQGLLIVEDARCDPRFASLAAVQQEPGIRFYAGAALHSPTGHALGTCCVMDYRPRRLDYASATFLKQTIALIEREMQDREIVTELRETIKNQALLDPVTGLPNLILFRDKLDQKIKRHYRDVPHLIIAVRLNRYDALDSAMGRLGAAYMVGDVAARVRKVLGSDCVIGQIREDELAVTCPSGHSESLSENEMLDRLARCFKEPFVFGDEPVLISATIGVSSFPRDGNDAGELLRRARIALRSEASQEKSTYRVYSPELSTRTDQLFKLEVALVRSVEQESLQVVFQPKISLRTGKITGAEALLRWRDPEVGEISPGLFVPLAERMGLTEDIARLAVTKVVAQLAAWQKSLRLQPTVSVNVSGTQFRQPIFAEMLIQSLLTSGIGGEQLNLEITESSLIEDIEGATRVMHILRRHRISFSIDDFGTGFSSLSYLRKMPLSVLKIDRSFIQHIPDNANDMAIANSVIALGHSLGFTVVAEGAETMEQVRFLRENGCDEVQGFVFSRPVTASEFQVLLAEGRIYAMQA